MATHSQYFLSNKELQSTVCYLHQERYWKTNPFGINVPLLIWGTKDGMFLIRKFKKHPMVYVGKKIKMNDKPQSLIFPGYIEQ